MNPDLNTDPMMLLAIAALLGIVSLALWLYERKHDGRPHPADDARADRARASDPSARDARAARRGATDRDRLGYLGVGSDRSGRRGRAAYALDLTDDELLALARYLQLGWVAEDQRSALIDALNKTDSVARRVIAADRAGRRK